MSRFDLLVVGAGPAGMSAAITARRHGLTVIVIDEQPGPGGQIWRSVEARTTRDEVLGPSYVEGRPIAESFRGSGAVYQPSSQLWQVEDGFVAYVSRERRPEVINADAIILATGAQERPCPFPGWTLPGVLTVGAAQILLKTAGELPDEPVWIAGCGPLPLLYAVQLVRAGGHIAGFLETTPPGQRWAAARHLPQALRASTDLLKGLSWQRELRSRGVPVVKGVAEIEAEGNDRLETVRYRVSNGPWATADANVLLIHEGVVPNIHAALGLGCTAEWNEAQDCFRPLVDEWGESSRANLFVAGDGAGIAGAKAALLRGELSALRVADKLGRIDRTKLDVAAVTARRKLRHELAVRPFLDTLFKPRAQIRSPADETIICRCEEVTAGRIREMAMVGRPGINQMKTVTRAGMGPCQGRMCGYTVNRLLAATQGRSPQDVGYLNIRPPLKPVTIGELAEIDSLGS